MAYVFERCGSEWIEIARLVPSDGVVGDRFGAAVALDGDTALVGAPEAGDEGAVYIFERSGPDWIQVAKRTAITGASGDRYGDAVALDGEWAFVGAWGDDDQGSQSGSVWIYERNGGLWSFEAKLLPGGVDASDAFGISVDVSGDWAVVGAEGDGDGGFLAGAVYVFEFDAGSWSEYQKVVPAGAGFTANFGHSVAIDGSYFAAGAPADDPLGLTDAGSASVYRLTFNLFPTPPSWNFQQQLVASDAASQDNFGASVGIDGKRVVVGSPLDDDGAAAAGSAYLFERNIVTWNEIEKLAAGDPVLLHLFGGSVAVAGDYLAAGAVGDDDLGSAAGAAYVFSATGDCGGPPPCGNLTYGAGASAANVLGLNNAGGTATGTTAQIATSGVTSGVAFTALSLGSDHADLLGGVVLVDQALLIQLETVPAVAGTATWAVPIPANFALVGLPVYFQSLAAEPLLPLGTAFSNGLRLIICPLV